MGRAGIVKEKIKKSKIGGYARSAWLRASPAGSEEGFSFALCGTAKAVP
jgi:hypothetical protein